ncbi:MAG: ribonuclease E/G [Lachnospiraceae bacterium]|nr:ribonuclease E/G [Lachnospiraceae bacterium]
MRKRYVITRMEIRGREYLIYTEFDDRGKLQEISASPADQDELLGNIYIGKVKDIAASIDAAFVEIAPGRRCFLSCSGLRQPLFTKKIGKKLICQDEELVVQVVRDAVKTKIPEVSGDLQLEGQYLVLTAGNHKLGVSNKLPSDVSMRLREAFLNGIKAIPGAAEELGRDYGCILRTNAERVPIDQVILEYEKLREQYLEIVHTAPHRTAYSLIRKAKPFYLKELEGIPYEEEAQIVTDCPDIYETILQQQRFLPDMDRAASGSDDHSAAERPCCRVSLYQDDYPLSKLYSLEKQIEDACRERVWLKSGAYLVITPTEALTVIDVNSGKQNKGKDSKENYRKINLEAADEIARQLRIRNISGICVVDFINLDTKEAQAELMQHFRRALSADRVPVHLVDITKLGLVELTRKKVKRSLIEQLKNS